jgi:long-chain acyl-CoA synthetase
LADTHLARLAEAALERHGDREALFFEGRWHRSGELLERSRRLAGGLRELGVEPGDRVLVLMANCPEVVVAYNAIWRAGAVATPVTFLLSAAEVRRVTDDAEPRAAITTPELEATAREAVGEGTPVISADDFARLEAAAEAPIVERADDDLAALIYTGGTTGRAKGVMLTHANLWHAGKAGFDAGYVPGVVRGLTALPLSHSYGLLVTVAGMHTVEPGSAVLLRWFDPGAWLEQAQAHRVQQAAVVPSMIRLLLAEPLERFDLSELRDLVSGAAPLPPQIAAELEERLPGVELREGYGLTETSALAATNRPGRVRRGSVGEPVPGAEVRVVDEEGAVLGPGEVGEICCRSPFVMAGYWRDPDLTRDVLRDGWVHTGDMGYLDEDGYLFVVDRKKDLIIRGGFNVFPRDVEDALLEHPAVEAAAVVGRPDAEHGEEVVAFVALSHKREPAAIVSWARERIGGYKYPREVVVVDALPLTPVGKVDRKALRARLPQEVEA